MKKTIKTMLAALIAVSMLPVMSAFADSDVAAVDTNAKLRPASALFSSNCDSTSGFYNNNGLAPEIGTDANGNSVLKLTRTTNDFRFWKWVDSQSSTLNSAEGITYQFDFYTASNQTDGSSSGLLVYSRGHNDGGNDTNLVSLRPRPSDPNTVQIKKGGKDGEVLASFSSNKWHTLAFSITHEAGSTTYTYDIYIDGELEVEDQTFTLSRDNMHFFGWRTDNSWWSQGNPSGDEYFIDNFYAYAGAAKTIVVEKPVIVNPDPVLVNGADDSAEKVQQSGDFVYGWTYSENVEFSAASGDIDARIWVNGCPIGTAAQGDGITIAFDTILPATNPGRIYYTYSDQSQPGQNVFMGFKYMPDSGKYRLLSNLAHEDANDEYYNSKLYSGKVPVMLYIKGQSFDLYVNGEKIGDNVNTGVDLGTRWYYAFISYYAGNTSTSFKIANLKYLKGKAITQVQLSSPVLTLNPAKPAADGSNAFYYMIDVQMNDADANSLDVKYYPEDKSESVAAVQSFNMSNIEGEGKVTFISALKGIPANQADREIVAKAILGYELGGSVFSINASKTNALSDVK